MDKRLLDILCCPVSKAPLKLLNRVQLDALNRDIAAGAILTTGGMPVGAALSAALVTNDGKRIYRVEDDIPVMLADEAIATAQLRDFRI